MENFPSKNGLKAGRDHFQKTRNDDTYVLWETEMNYVGYQLLSAQKLEEAFPDSWNVYDSLGEAYMNVGDKGQAILNYKRSIERNLKNENVTAALKELEKR